MNASREALRIVDKYGLCVEGEGIGPIVKEIEQAITAAIEEDRKSRPHEFTGRRDRWCELCDKPDRDDVHLFSRKTLSASVEFEREACAKIADAQAHGFQVLIDHAPTEIRAGDLRRVVHSAELTASIIRARQTQNKENIQGGQMKIHIHDNNDPAPEKHNCLSETELTEGKILSLHMHPGSCRPCPQGHCHNGTINLLIVNGELFVVLEGVRVPSPITMAEGKPHMPVEHGKRWRDD